MVAYWFVLLAFKCCGFAWWLVCRFVLAYLGFVVVKNMEGLILWLEFLCVMGLRGGFVV